MNPTAYGIDISATGAEGLWRTNPVWCIDRLLARWCETDLGWLAAPDRLRRLLGALHGWGISLPPEAFQRWSERTDPATALDLPTMERPRPGLVGLVVDAWGSGAWVVPLTADRRPEWTADSTLPFRRVAELQDLFLRLLRTSGLPHVRAVPERFAYAIGDLSGRPSDGPSMHVTAVLAVIRAANGHPVEFDRACAVVQPSGERLVPVGGVQQKLEAFVRECGRGTLLVRAPGCTASAAFESSFDAVWEVGSLGDLARRLADHHLLDVFLGDLPLTPTDAEAARARLRRLADGEHRYQEALELAQRIEGCGYDLRVTAHGRREVQHATISLHRHLGDYERTAELCRREIQASRNSAASSYDDLAQMDTTYAAALYAPHQFAEISRLLEPWERRLAADPLLVTAPTRVRVFNTLGRAWSILGRPGWDSLFRQSAAILADWEPTDLPRTWCYLAQAFLRVGRVAEAQTVLDQIDHHPGLSDLSRWFFRFFQADAARRSGGKWDVAEMENGKPSERVDHPFGFYFQATARQPGRTPAEAVARFRRAQEFLSRTDPTGENRNIQPFLTACLRLGEAAWGQDAVLWADACRALRAHLEPRSGLGLIAYYRDFVPAPDSLPDRGAAERLLDHVPFF